MPTPASLPFRPYIIVFGDDSSQSVTKILWSHLAGQDVSVIAAADAAALEAQAPDALLVFVILNDEQDPRAGLGQALERPDIVCHVAALVREATFEQRMNILSHGYDSIFNLPFTEDRLFRKILLHHVEKGRTRLANRIHHDEYDRIRAALSFSSASLVIFDDQDRLFFVSDHYRKAYPGWGEKLARGMKAEDAFALFCAEEGFSESDPRHEGLRRFWMTREGEHDFRDDQGRVLKLIARPLAEGQGTIVIVTNMTRIVGQQAELARQSDELAAALEKEREAGAIQKQFISMVSHEFRTPLTVIDGHAQIIERRGDTLEPADIQRRVRTIRSAVSRLILLIEGVLSSNMVKTGRFSLTPEPFDLRRAIRDLCDEHADLAGDCHVELDLDGLPEEVTLDRKVCLLSISNLLANAIKFSPGGPRVRVTGWAADGMIHVRVEDKGMGIPENEVGRVFERYYRATTASFVPGTGLGLSLVKDMADLHGGAVALESREGEGTSVTFSLPSSGGDR